MIQSVGKELCYGCTACYAACSLSAISMCEDKEGFKYPEVDNAKCVSCGACIKVCPALNRELTGKSTILKAYAMKHDSDEVLEKSASGGMFTALSDYVLSNGGSVYGAAFDENMVVRHMRAVSKDIRDKMRDSKYVQSDMGDMFLKVKQDLKNEQMVLFTGTPCQIDGLKNYLKSDYENLICVDLICHGSPSPGLLKAHFEFINKKNKTRVVGYKFRSKRWTWNVHREIVFFENGKEYHSNAWSDLWQSIYYMRLAMRPSCHNCKYSNLDRAGDLTIADCRGIDEVLPDFGSEKGASLVFVNTPKGKKIFDEISKCAYIAEIDVEKVMQPPLRNPSTPNKYREAFWTAYHNGGYKKAVQSYFGKLYKLKYIVKKILKK